MGQARWPCCASVAASGGVLELAGFEDAFRVTVSSEEVKRGKPDPDVYLKARVVGDITPALVEQAAGGRPHSSRIEPCRVCDPTPGWRRTKRCAVGRLRWRRTIRRKL